MELSTVSVTLADLVKNASEPGFFTTFLTNFFSGTNIALLGAVLALPSHAGTESNGAQQNTAGGT